jgi:hypothetical protein
VNGSDVDNHAFSCGVHSSSKGFIRLTVAIGTPATIPSVDHAEITSHIVDNSNVILRALDLLVTRGASRVVSTPDGLAAAAALATLGNAKTVVRPTSIHDAILCAIDCLVSRNSKDHSTPVATVSSTAAIAPIGSTDVAVRTMSGAHVPRRAYNCKIQQRVVAGSGDQPERAGAGLVEHHRVSGDVNACAHPHLCPNWIE